MSWYRRYRETGEVSARKQGQPSGSKLDAHEAFILALVRERLDISLAEIAGHLAEKQSVDRMTLRVGNQEIEARIAEREEARRHYKKAKSQGKRAALVEQHRPNNFTR